MTTNTDTLFRPLTIATAPRASRPALEQIQKSHGFIPNLMATFANNPAVLQGYLALDAAYEKGLFTPRERQIILLAASVENSCDYCTAAHSTIAKGALHTPPEVIAAIRKGLAVPDAKLDALVKPFFPDGWAASAGGFPAMTKHVAFLMKDLVLFAVSFYLLKQDVVRATAPAKEPALTRTAEDKGHEGQKTSCEYGE